MSSLGEELPKEIARVRDEVIPAYEEVLEIAPLTQITIEVMKAQINTATKALAEGDVIQIMLSYEELKEIQI